MLHVCSVKDAELHFEGAELSNYFAGKYLDGELYDGGGYAEEVVEEIFTYKYDTIDGAMFVWQFAFDLRSFGKPGEPFTVLYHYTNKLCFQNVGNVDQSAAELFASLVDSRAHFGKGVYTTQHEPAATGPCFTCRVRLKMR